MARRIIWSKKAEDIFNKILLYYVKRNKSKTFSRKLNIEIKKTVLILAKNPFLGKATDNKSVRVLIKNHYHIFYQVTKDEVIIHLIWDTRQDPEKLKLK